VEYAGIVWKLPPQDQSKYKTTAHAPAPTLFPFLLIPQTKNKKYHPVQYPKNNFSSSTPIVEVSV
jgi:hypothetical protein